MKTAATTAGVAARTGAEEAGAAASMGAQGAAMIRSIMSSAAETFAGVFGFLAPLLGPLAAGPAAGAQATVAGIAGSVASADIGMWQVPQDMLSLVHHNELIMPAARSRRVSRSLSERRRRVRRAKRLHRTHPSDNQFPRFGAQFRLRLAMDEEQQLRHAEGDGRSGAPRGASRPAPTGCVRGHGLRRRRPSAARQPANSPTTRFPHKARNAQRPASGRSAINTFYAPGGSKTDYSYALDQLQAAHPECTTVSLVVCAWFCNSENAANCNIYPSTTYLARRFRAACRRRLDADPLDGLEPHHRTIVRPHPASRRLRTTASSMAARRRDPSIVRCIRDLKSRGFRVIFYPFLLMTAPGFPWRGRISYSRRTFERRDGAR